jgi:hypothetical protein
MQIIMSTQLPTPSGDTHTTPGLIAPGPSVMTTVEEKGGVMENQRRTVTTMFPRPAAHAMIVPQEVGTDMTLMTFNIEVGDVSTSMIAAGRFTSMIVVGICTNMIAAGKCMNMIAAGRRWTSMIAAGKCTSMIAVGRCTSMTAAGRRSTTNIITTGGMTTNIKTGLLGTGHIAIAIDPVTVQENTDQKGRSPALWIAGIEDVPGVADLHKTADQ